jgi:Domain of unknown function (DUF4926)
MGEMMDSAKKATNASKVRELDVVALLADIPGENLTRGQVGTVVDLPGNGTALVEFSDDDGKAYAFVAVSEAQLLPLVYEHRAA